jgi:hypothetical protein
LENQFFIQGAQFSIQQAGNFNNTEQQNNGHWTTNQELERGDPPPRCEVHRLTIVQYDLPHQYLLRGRT